MVRLTGCFRLKISLPGVLQGVRLTSQKQPEEMDFPNDSGTGSMQNRPLQQIGKAEGHAEEDKWDRICSRTERRTQNARETFQSISVIRAL